MAASPPPSSEVENLFSQACEEEVDGRRGHPLCFSIPSMEEEEEEAFKKGGKCLKCLINPAFPLRFSSPL